MCYTLLLPLALFASRENNLRSLLMLHSSEVIAPLFSDPTDKQTVEAMNINQVKEVNILFHCKKVGNFDYNLLELSN